MNKYKETATLILDKLGGKDNISFVTHCMTRLRFNVKDESLVREEEVKKIQGVLGIQMIGGQFQVIIGPNVEKVYTLLCQEGGFTTQEVIMENLDKQEKQGFSWKRLGGNILDGISGCLTPVLPILICAGLLKMIVALIGPEMLKLASETSDIYVLLSFIADAGFYFLPIFVAMAGAKKFGCNQMIAVLMACILLHPTLTEIIDTILYSEGSFTVYGIPMMPAIYSTSVLPMIMVAYVMSYVEAWLKKVIPDVLMTTCLPLLTVLIMTPLTLCLLGPIGTMLGFALGQGLTMLYDIFGPLGAGIVAILWCPIVITGMHLPILATALVSVAQNGSDSLLIGAVLGAYSCMAISLAVMIKAKNQEDKALGLSCFVAQALGGVGEPTLYGILMRYKRTLLYCSIGTFAGSLYSSFMGSAIYFLATANFMGALCFGGENPTSLLHGIIGGVITFVLTFVLCILFGYEDKNKETIQQ